MNIGIIGDGAIGSYVRQQLLARDFDIRVLIVSARKFALGEPHESGLATVANAEDIPDEVDHVIDCAGHQALRMHGPSILERGIDLSTVSIGALAEPELCMELERAAAAGKAKPHVAIATKHILILFVANDILITN